MTETVAARILVAAVAILSRPARPLTAGTPGLKRTNARAGPSRFRSGFPEMAWRIAAGSAPNAKRAPVPTEGWSSTKEA